MYENECGSSFLTHSTCVLHQAPYAAFPHRALMFSCNDLPLCRVCSAVSSNAAAEETQAQAARGAGCEGAGAARHRLTKSSPLRRSRGQKGELLPARRTTATPPQEAGQEAAEGGGQGQHSHVTRRVALHRAGGRGLPAVHSGPAGRSGPGSLRSPV